MTEILNDLAGNAPSLLEALGALSNPHRLRIIASLHTGGRKYVSQLARELGISRPLLHLHLAKLEQAGLVASEFEISADGKALKFLEATDFAITLTPETIAADANSLPTPSTQSA